MNIDIVTSTTTLYCLGFEALSAEINILRSRKNDDPFISGLRDFQEQLPAVFNQSSRRKYVFGNSRSGSLPAKIPYQAQPQTDFFAWL